MAVKVGKIVIELYVGAADRDICVVSCLVWVEVTSVISWQLLMNQISGY